MKKMNSVILFILLLSFNLQAQIFRSDGGYQSFPAQSVGIPNNANGNVLVKRAPNPAGNVGEIRRQLNQATIPDVVINSRLTQGVFARHIAQMPAVIQTARALNARLATKATQNGDIVIDSQADLNNNLNAIASNATRTFIFRGNINTNSAIKVGSNTTIWIDGVITYTGPVVPTTSGDQFSPLGTVRSGIFIAGNQNASNGRIKNVTIRGTKRGLADCKGRLPFLYSPNSDFIKVLDMEIINGLNTIFLHSCFDFNIENNFIYNNVRRGVHTLAVGRGSIRRNLVYDNHLDGIDIDASSRIVTSQYNVIVGARFRLMLWSEVDAEQNVFDNNVGIHLDRKRGIYAGGFEENGNEPERQPGHPKRDTTIPAANGNRNNTWKHNNVFYALDDRDGIYMFKERFILHKTISYDNNYVWTVAGNIKRHNPRPEGNMQQDVRYLTLQAPVAGARPNPTNTFPQEAIIAQTPGNLTFAQIKSTPNLGSNPNPVGGSGEVVTNLGGVYYINNQGATNQTLGIDGVNARLKPGGSTDVQWIVRKVPNTSGNGTLYTIESMAARNRYLEVPFASCTNRLELAPNVATYTNNTLSHQKWIIKKRNNSFILIPSHCPGAAIDRFSGTPTADARLVLLKPGGIPHPNQNWGMARIGNAPGSAPPVIPSTGGGTIPRWKVINFRRDLANGTKYANTPGTNGTVRFTSGDTGKYYVDADGPNSDQVAIRIDNSNGIHYLFVNSNNQIVLRKGNKSVGTKFKWIPHTGNSFSLRVSTTSNQYAFGPQRATDFAPNLTTVIRDQIGAWEKFVYKINGSAKELNAASNPLDIDVYPNPVNAGSSINVNVSLEKSSNVITDLVDLNGKVVYSNTVSAEAGAQQISIDSTDLSKGLYLLRVRIGLRTKIEKVIIQ